MRGHIRKRGNKWAIVIYDKEDRKYKWFSGYDKKKDAEKDLPNKLQEVNHGLVDASKETIRSYLKSWLEDKKMQVRPGTYRSYEWLVTKHIIPNISNEKLLNLKPKHLQTLYTKLQKNEPPISNRSILHAHMIIYQALKRAVKWGMIPRNIADAVDPPRPNSPEIKVWTQEEISSFLEIAKNSQYYIVYRLAVSTGMRLGEILALQWDDIDLEKGIIQIRRTYSYTGKGYTIQEPKTNSGKRSIPISEATLQSLQQHKENQEQQKQLAGELWQEHNLVCSSGVGTYCLQSNVRSAFYRLVKKSGITRIRIHDLRHTFASILLKQGVHPKVVQELLGHANIQTTLNTYSHIMPGIKEEAILKFDEFLTKNTNKSSL